LEGGEQHHKRGVRGAELVRDVSDAKVGQREFNEGENKEIWQTTWEKRDPPGNRSGAKEKSHALLRGGGGANTRGAGDSRV